MQTPKLKSRNLFTLNRESNQQSNSVYASSRLPVSEMSDSSQESPQVDSQQLTRLRLRIRELQKKESVLLGVISDLENQLQHLSQKFANSESKTKQLIQKLSKQQVYNKELEYQVQVLEQEMGSQRQNGDSMNRTIAELALTLKQVVESIGQSPSCVKTSLQRVGSLELDINVHQPLRRLSAIQDSKGTLKQIEKVKAQLEQQKAEKKRILPAYNQLLSKMRANCTVLKQKVDEVYRKSDEDKEHFERLLLEKEETIRVLTIKNKRLGVEGKEGDQRFFIGDYKKVKLQKELSQIDREILQIQNNLKEQLNSSRLY